MHPTEKNPLCVHFFLIPHNSSLYYSELYLKLCFKATSHDYLPVLDESLVFLICKLPWIKAFTK